MDISNIKTSKSEAALLNKMLAILISLGDLLIGIYLTMISVNNNNSYHSISFCSIQLNWLSSNTCIALGIISTTGFKVSLLSMTTLGLLRVSGIKNNFAMPKEITNKSLVKVVAIVFAILVASIAISWLPLVEQLEDFFVNGVKYDETNSLFIGCPGKYVHREILQKYYGRIATEDLTWAQIKVLVNATFSNDYGGISRYKLSFYGNAPVCLFKYYVKINDPQQGFVFAIICLNFACFITIAVCYGTIVTKVNKSANSLNGLANNKNKMENPTKKANAKLQRVTQWIIFTDFACWVPFIITCCLHYVDIIDATPWYSIFSILVLPINSVINLLIYNIALITSIDSKLNKLKDNKFALKNIIIFYFYPMLIRPWIFFLILLAVM